MSGRTAKGTAATGNGSAGTRPTGEDAYRDSSAIVVPAEVRIVDGHDLDRDLEVSVDAVVIGTGAGGAPVAKELAEGGMRVAMVEEGRRYTTDDYTAKPSEMTTRLYRDAGQIATTGVPPVLLPLGKSIGGSTLINSGTCFRTPPAVLELWAERFGLEMLSPEALDPCFRRVERELNVSQVPPDLAGRNTAVIKRGADALGYSGDYIYRNVRGCVGSGICNFGCPTSAKQHVGVTYVPKAWDAGATTYSGFRARHVLVESGRAAGVEARSASGRRLTVRAGTVIVAAGTIHTPLLLESSGLAGESGELGRNLSLHPASGLRALFDEEVEMHRGVPQAYFIDEFAGEGIMFEGAAGPPDYLALSMPYIGERHREVMSRYPSLSQFGIMISDDSRGSVSRLPGGRPLIRYDLVDSDVRRFERAFRILAEIYWAAGAKAIYTPLPGVPELRDRDSEPLKRELRAAALDLVAFHPLGTARAGTDPTRSVVDENLRLHHTDGVYVADGSAVPSSLGVNPQITIMALATRLAYHLLGKELPRDEPEPERIAEPRVSVAHVA
jgi:choline dehydrogenase-like flavoprotein